MSKSMVIAFALILLIIPAPAFAYIDPAAGAFVLQLVVAGIAGVAVTLKIYWSRISGWVRRIGVYGSKNKI